MGVFLGAPLGRQERPGRQQAPTSPKAPASCRQDVRSSLPRSKPSVGSDRCPDSQPGALHAGSQRFCLGGPIPRPRGSRPLRRQPDKTHVPTSSLGGEHLRFASSGAASVHLAPLPGPPSLRLNATPSHPPQPSPPISGSVCLLAPPGLPRSVSPTPHLSVWASLNLPPRSPNPSLSPPPSPLPASFLSPGSSCHILQLPPPSLEENALRGHNFSLAPGGWFRALWTLNCLPGQGLGVRSCRGAGATQGQVSRGSHGQGPSIFTEAGGGSAVWPRAKPLPSLSPFPCL